MSHLDAFDDELAVASPIPQAHSLALRWPVLGVLALALVGLLAAAVRSPKLSGITYVVLLVVGCGLLFYRRYDAIKATRSAGGSGLLTVQRIEKVAIAVLATACLVNGVVLANYEVATWAFWSFLPGGDA